MLPGKKYKPEDFLRILRKRIWLVLVPFAIVSAGTALVARKLPNVYRSTTTILVVPQRVPEEYVKSTVTTRIEDRLVSIAQQILSRTRLERIIDDFGLYADERRTGIMEDIVQTMRNKDIKIDLKNGDAFTVAYIGRDPKTVMRVTERLASLFIQESLQDRAALADGTNQFLEGTLEDARRQLRESEQKLEAYKKQFVGELPSQLQANMQAQVNTSMQIQAIVQAIHDEQQRKLSFEREIAQLESPDAVLSQHEPATADISSMEQMPRNATAAQQLAYAKAILQSYINRKYGEQHPQVKAIRVTIAQLEKQAEAEALQQPVSASAQKVSPAERARKARLELLRTDLEQVNQQIAFNQSEERRLRGVVAVLQRRIDAAPTRETEMQELTRDYATLQSLYDGYVEKWEASKISANLERRQIGEQFKVLDPASFPERPSSPNRPQINIMGMVAGLAVGFALIALLEYRDGGFRTDEEVMSVLTLPVLAVVPLMQSDPDRRKLLRRRLLVGFGLGTTVLGCLAVLAYTFIR